MKIYFLSSTPCALTVNGVYFGVSDLFDRHAELSLKENLFIQFTPEHSLPIGFFLTENILFSPPDGCEVYFLPSALAIYARDFPPKASALEIITQARFEKNLITVFKQGALQVSLETEKGFFIATLPPSFSECSLEKQGDFYLLRSPTQLAVFTDSGKQILLETVLHYSVDGDLLLARLPLSDSLRRYADCKWRLTSEDAQLNAFELRQENGAHAAEELLPYAFFESVLLGADYTQLLCENLQPSAARLKEYLGEFQSVILTENPNRLGLVKAKAERLYEVNYYTITLENGKISDVSPSQGG